MKKNKLYGAILGDLAGQPYEFPILKHFPPVETINLHNPESKITDDTLMTLATAKSLMDNQPIEEAYKEIGLKYQGDHYGKGFKEWLNTPIGTVGKSWGNGCIMRISPYMYIDTMPNGDGITLGIIESCLTSHSHPTSIVSCIALQDLYQESEKFKDYARDPHKPNSLRNNLKQFEKFKVRADETLQFCGYVALCYTSTHEAMKFAISLGGDTDTNASIIGELMNNIYQDITKEDVEYVDSKLDPFLLDILHRFQNFKT